MDPPTTKGLFKKKKRNKTINEFVQVLFKKIGLNDVLKTQLNINVHKCITTFPVKAIHFKSLMKRGNSIYIIEEWGNDYNSIKTSLAYHVTLAEVSGSYFELQLRETKSAGCLL